MERSPAVEGYFYPSSKKELEEAIEKMITKAKAKELEKEPCAFVVPHAGYIYSGFVAAHAYKLIKGIDVESIVVIGPNHTGLGKEVSVSLQNWNTPVGTVENDVELSKEIVNCSKLAEFDEYAHAKEHSIEVQLPF
ncbi:MAG: AmmeMemoRadiSam system protein B, partial [Candidatus Micrarchaeaceae archaeon]